MQSSKLISWRFQKIRFTKRAPSLETGAWWSITCEHWRLLFRGFLLVALRGTSSPIFLSSCLFHGILNKNININSHNFALFSAFFHFFSPLCFLRKLRYEVMKHLNHMLFFCGCFSLFQKYAQIYVDHPNADEVWSFPLSLPLLEFSTIAPYSNPWGVVCLCVIEDKIFEPRVFVDETCGEKRRSFCVSCILYLFCMIHTYAWNQI